MKVGRFLVNATEQGLYTTRKLLQVISLLRLPLDSHSRYLLLNSLE
jgi:hypothetical protein